MRSKVSYFVCFCLVAMAPVWLGPPIHSGQRVDDKLWKEALRIHADAVVVDAHAEALAGILDDGADLGQKSDTGQIDIPRMKQGGIDAEFFAIRVAPQEAGEGGTARRALDMIDAVYQLVDRHSDSLELATSAADIRRIAKQGKIAVLMGIEGDQTVAHSLGVLRMFYKLGVRSMALTRAGEKTHDDASVDGLEHPDLTEFERQAVLEMNRLGMLVDVSQVPEKTLTAILNVTSAPVIASHSAARAMADLPGNMSDDMLQAVARKGGVVMVGFGASVVDQNRVDAIRMRDEIFRPALRELRRRFPNDPAAFARAKSRLYAAFELPKTPLSKVVDHIDHIAKLAGVDHVGLGSGFGGDAALPQGLEDCSKLPTITYELLKRGYRSQDVRKILGENVLRVMSQAAQISEKMSKTTPAPPAGSQRTSR